MLGIFPIYGGAINVAEFDGCCCWHVFGPRLGNSTRLGWKGWRVFGGY
jgi:hypothetical protein